MTHSDEPVLHDSLAHAPHVETLADVITNRPPPFVLGVHGDWGAGKSSFLKKLRWYLVGSGLDDRLLSKQQLNELGKKLWPQSYNGKGQNVETIWFEAWRYQNDPHPVVALLNEIRAHFAEKKNVRALSTRAIGEAGKLAYAALMSIEEVTKQIGIQPSKIIEGGEKWERDRLQDPLPSQLCRDLLDDAIQTLLGRRTDRRLVVFIDDLDRCTGPVAFQLLEALKIYLSLPSCVFVLGLDWRTIRQAVASQMVASGMVEDDQPRDVALLRADDYLDKLCQAVHRLPLMVDPRTYLTTLMESPRFNPPDSWINLIVENRLLPANPRKVKSFVSDLAVYLQQLQAVLVGEDVDDRLALIVAYLKLYENDVFRILESDERFWDEIVRFCRIGPGHPQTGETWKDIHDVFSQRRLSSAPEFGGTLDPDSEFTPAGYSPLFADPADERVFRVAELVRKWDNDHSLTTDLFRKYVQLRSP